MNEKWRSHIQYAATRVLPSTAVFLVIGWIVAVMLGGFESKVEPAHVVRPVRKVDGAATDEVHEVTKPYVEEAVGTLKAATRTAISAKVLAVIEEFKVTAGSQVAVGDVLVRLDSRELEARVQQAKQNLTAAQARRAEADSSFRRIKELRAKNVVPQAEFEQAQAKLEVDQAAEITAEQAVKEAEAHLSYATLTAPKSGRVVERLAQEGDTARPGEPLLTIYDSASLRLEAPVQENLAVRLRLGQPLDVYIDALDREIKATIDEIVPQADAPSRSLLVKAAVPRSDDM